MKDVYNALYLWHYHIQMRHEYPIHLYSELQMFGYSQIITCCVIIGTACITGHQFTTAMIGMRSGIVQTKDYLRCPLLPPPFFPKAQTRTESPVLIREFSPRLFREISRAMIRMYQCTDIRHLQPRENSNINVIIEGIPHFTATKMVDNG